MSILSVKFIRKMFQRNVSVTELKKWNGKVEMIMKTHRVDHVVHEFVYCGAFEPGLPAVPHDFSVITWRKKQSFYKNSNTPLNRERECVLVSVLTSDLRIWPARGSLLCCGPCILWAACCRGRASNSHRSRSSFPKTYPDGCWAPRT